MAFVMAATAGVAAGKQTWARGVMGNGRGILFLAGSPPVVPGTPPHSLRFVSHWLSPWRASASWLLDPGPKAMRAARRISCSHHDRVRRRVVGVGLAAALESCISAEALPTHFAVLARSRVVGVATVVVILYWWSTGVEIGDRRCTRAPFAGLVVQGVGLCIGIQTFINVGVDRFAPTRAELPLMS